MAAVVAVAGSPAETGDFIITTNTNYELEGTAARLTVLSPTGSVRLTSVILQDKLPRIPGRLGLTAVSPDAMYAFTPMVKSEPTAYDAVFVTPLSDSTKLARKVKIRGSGKCSFLSSAPIAAGSVSSNGDYTIYVGRECSVKCARDPTGSYFTRKVLAVRYRPSTNTMKFLPTQVYSTNKDGCSSEFLSFGSLRVLNGQLYGLVFSSTRTIQLLQFSGNVVRASLSGFDYCNSWSFVIAAANSFYGTCVMGNSITGADSTIPALVRVTGTKVTQGPSPPGGKDGLNRYQRIYDSITTEPDSRSIYTFLEGGKFGNATLFKLDKKKFEAPPKPILEVKPEILASGGDTLRVEQLLIVP